MKDTLVSLSKKNRDNIFLKNKLKIRCKCGHTEKITYYDFLSGGEFSIGENTQTISPFISEAVIEETISLTPINLTIKCPVCGEDITTVFPLSLQDTISLLASLPPDPQMYG
ncbi:MAG: hypothetical protein SCH70_02650 [Candidatus Methanoperedens sp.]|nr:hypothetical protein [Candidatus Methanoperedens sp.]